MITKVISREEHVGIMQVESDEINKKIHKLEEKSKSTRTLLANKYKQEMSGIWR